MIHEIKLREEFADAVVNGDKILELLTAFADADGVDAVEVVRCKDCKYHRGENACEKDGCYGWYDTDYCSRAERKDHETD